MASASTLTIPNPNVNLVSLFSGDSSFILFRNSCRSYANNRMLPLSSETKVKKTRAAKRNSRTCRSQTKIPCLARVWREVQGMNNWQNLVEPLDPILKQEIVRYGEFAGACYKAFDLDPGSSRYLCCKYGKREVLREIGMDGCGYNVTKYVYATPEVSIPRIGNGCGRWIGFVAVAEDEEVVRRLGRRDVVVAFRGTVTTPEWIANLMSNLTPARLDPSDPRPDVKVEAGFLSLYTSDESDYGKFGLGSCREQLLSEISRLLNKYKGEELSITLAGHSMGSSLALLLAYDIAELGLVANRDISLTVFSFGGPRVGNSGFKERCEELGVKVLRVVNVNDPITKLPGVVFNENILKVLGGRYELPWSWSCYAHVGVELTLDFFELQTLSCVHDLENYISSLKCPEIKSTTMQREGIEFLLDMVRGLIQSVQNLDTQQLRNVAMHMVTMVQCLRT